MNKDLITFEYQQNRIKAALYVTALQIKCLGKFFEKFRKKLQKYLAMSKISLNFATQKGNNPYAKDSVAQLVEQLTLNQWVESSSLSGVTKTNYLD